MCLQLQSLWWMKNFCVPVTANVRRRIYPGCCISELSKPGINFFFRNEKKAPFCKNFNYLQCLEGSKATTKSRTPIEASVEISITETGSLGWPRTWFVARLKKKYIERHHESSRLACLRSWNCPFLLPFLPPSLSTVLHTCLISKVLRGLASGTVTKMKCSGWELRRGRREGWDGEQSPAAVPQGRGSQAVTALAWLTADS